jgi:hypothetical protein
MNPGFISNGHRRLWIVLPDGQRVIMLTDYIKSAGFFEERVYMYIFLLHYKYYLATFVFQLNIYESESVGNT